MQELGIHFVNSVFAHTVLLLKVTLPWLKVCTTVFVRKVVGISQSVKKHEMFVHPLQ